MKARAVVLVDYLDVYSPRLYRVYFWERPGIDYGYNLDAWDLVDCVDAAEALAWAAAHSNARLYQVFAVTSDSGGDAERLVLLHGRNPNIPGDD
ncbi:hypothetical protein GCM10009860_13430 [Microbacterium mitrae]